MQINFEPTVKQFELMQAFDDAKTTQLTFGGSASCGKSYGGCAMTLTKCLQYPGIRPLVGREELINLKRTTLMTMLKVLTDWGLKKDVHYKFNQQSSELQLFNGSTMLFKQLKYEPHDPECTDLGSLEITFAFIDEATQIHRKVIEILHSRCGRWMNKELKIKPFLLMTCNPGRGYIFDKFYKPFKNNNLEDFRKFIPATIDDNHHMDPSYKDHLLKTLSHNDKQRLVFGIWEFDDDPNALVKYDKVNALFDYMRPDKWDGTKYITADIAFTSDKCVLILWDDLNVIEIIEVNKEHEKPEDVIKALQLKHGIRNSNVAYDATGAGNYLKNYLPGAYVFHANARPIKTKEFEHLKTQTYFLLAESIMLPDPGIKIFDNRLKDETIDEVLQIKTLPKEKTDAVIKMIKKDDIKKTIGRSPDILDALSMRFIWEIKTQFKQSF